MRSFAQKPKATQQNIFAKSTTLGRGHHGQSHEVRSILHLQRTIDNQALHRILQTDAQESEAGLTGTASAHFGHDFSRIPIHSPTAGAILAKLAINKPGDEYEQEADRIAEQIMRTPEPCACVVGCPKCQAEQAGQLHQHIQTSGNQTNDASETVAPPIVYDVRSPGQRLDATARTFFEPRFGHDFSHVRIHTDSQAAEASHVLNARAFTIGHHVFFGAGEYQPGNSAGQHLIAHELVHTVQQSHSTPKIQRFVSCTRARLSLEECPKRESGEAKDSRREPMIIEYLESPVEGFLLANFGVGQSSLKPNAKKHPNWTHLINAMSNSTSQWKLLGFSDCHGDDRLNTSLRQDRADAVHAALPSAATNQVVGARAVPLHDCITDNTSRIDRALNRSVLIALNSREVTFKPEAIEGTRPVPKPKLQPTVDCSTAKKLEISHAQPIAVAMVKKALGVLAQPETSAIKSLLEKYFNDSSSSTYIHVIAGFKKTLSGLESNVKIECENRGGSSYNERCNSSKTDVTIAYVRTRRGLFAFRVHVCEAAFGRSDLDFAQTLVHEFNHMFDHTTDHEYCAMGCSSSLSRWDAYDNADSYSSFAKEAYMLL